MKQLLGILCLGSWLLAGFAKADTYEDDCANLVGSCEYYACIEQNRLSCGPQGYAMGYVKKYCERYTAIDFPEARTKWEAEIFPADANAWRDNVRSCLQINMEQWFASDAPKTCSALYDFGFNSHPLCYTEGPSFCELTPENIVRVVLTIEPGDIFKPETIKQMRDTSRICVQQLDQRMALEQRRWVRQQLRNYQRLWGLLAQDPAQFWRLQSQKSGQ